VEHLNAMNSDLADGKTDLFESNTTDAKVANATDGAAKSKKEL